MNPLAPAVPICHIVTPVVTLGYGFDNRSLNASLRKFSDSKVPTAIILGSGGFLRRSGSKVERVSYIRDLEKLLRCVISYRTPLFISSANEDDLIEHLAVIEGTVNTVISEIPSEIRVINIETDGETEVDINPRADYRDTADRQHVNQPAEWQRYMRAMTAHPETDVILGAGDSIAAPYAAFALSSMRRQNVHLAISDALAARVYGGVVHMGQLLKHGGVCAVPNCTGAMGTLFSDGSFDTAPCSPSSKCSLLSVAPHALFREGRQSLPPDYTLNISGCSLEQVDFDQGIVKVRGALLQHSAQSDPPRQTDPNFKFRGIFVGRISDPPPPNDMESYITQIKGLVRAQQPYFTPDQWDIELLLYGSGNTEIIIAGEVFAATKEQATRITGIARMATELILSGQNRNVQLPEELSSMTEW